MHIVLLRKSNAVHNSDIADYTWDFSVEIMRRINL